MTKLPRHDFRGFTLVELLVTLGLIIILMSGVAFVFSAVSRSASVGQIIGEQVRDMRAAQGMLEADVRSMVPSKEGLPLVIRCGYMPAFTSLDELNSDRDYTAAASFAAINSRDANGTNDGLSPGAFTYDSRNHRLDTLSFFARNFFSRQTGNDGVFVSGNNSSEAYVSYGHLVLPDNSGSFVYSGDDDITPGSGTRATNPNNYFASNWILGRNVTLLKSPTNSTVGNISFGGVNELHYVRRSSAPLSLQPLGVGTTVSENYSTGGPAPTRYNFDSRMDMAGVSLDGFMGILRNHIAAADPTSIDQRWWGHFNGGYGTANVQPQSLMGPDRRYRAMPFLVPPLTSEKTAMQVPMFLPGCTQFIVEYAGDFLAQNNSGTVTGSILTGQTDGVIDFVNYDPDGTGDAPTTHQIRWYGLPRDTGGATDTGGAVISQPLGTLVNNADVVPLRDVLGGRASFEKLVPAQLANYRTQAVAADAGALTAQPSQFVSPHQYVCAWGPGDTFRPRLIRIVITLDDRSGASNPPQSQTFEYVFEVP